jgi:hypothetical protein
VKLVKYLAKLRIQIIDQMQSAMGQDLELVYTRLIMRAEGCSHEEMYP